MTTAADVSANITAIDGLAGKTTAFQIASGANGDSAEGIFVIFNPAKEAVEVALPAGNWNVYIDAEDAGTTALRSVEGNVSVAPISAMVLIREDDVVVEQPEETTEPTEATEPTAPADDDNKGGVNIPAIVAGVAAAAAAAAGVAAVVLKKKKQ
jgi:pullulanase